jgi:hypothetical protein
MNSMELGILRVFGGVRRPGKGDAVARAVFGFVVVGRVHGAETEESTGWQRGNVWVWCEASRKETEREGMLR